MISYFSYFMMNALSLIIFLLMILIGISFLTLMERKMLSYIQLRKGPNKVLLFGVFQPFSDAIKLFSKEFFLSFSFNLYFLISPMIILFISLICWIVFPLISNIFSFNFSFLFLFCCLGVGSYPLMMAGWSSNSAYSIIGSMRTCAQIISYEVSFIMIILSVLLFSESYSLGIFNLFNLNFFLFMWPIFIMFIVSMLAELNRNPFDFIEGESELVSGFNTEYYGAGFSMLFMGEYCSILFMSMMCSLIFVSSNIDSLMFMFFFQMFVYLIIVIRGVCPRMRYDELMDLCWKVFLPMSLSFLYLVICLKWLIMICMEV